MKTRIWEDPVAMSIVSVLGYLMNDDGEVVGTERTKVLVNLMPSIHTLTHRAILAMLITTLNDHDTKTFYQEHGLRVLHEWVLDGLRKKEANLSKEMKRVEMYSQVRALLRVLDINVKDDAARKQNSYLLESLTLLTEFLDNSGPVDFAPEWSRLNIDRRHFESACGVWSRKENVSSNPSPENGNGTTTKASPRSSTSLKPSSENTNKPAVSASTITTAPPRVPVASILEYQPKSFLQPTERKTDELDDDNEFVEDDDNDELMMMVSGDNGVITNVTPATPLSASASLETKIRAHGHTMEYGERSYCRTCRKMSAKRCNKCNCCPKCAQRRACADVIASEPASGSGSTNSTSSSSSSLSVSDRNVQVLGSAMDQAIFKAFKHQDFHSVFSLIQNGMDVNFQRTESDKSTALMAAAHHGRDDAVNKLLSLGANPCLVDKHGAAAWAFAEKNKFIELRDKLKKLAEEKSQQDTTQAPAAAAS